MLAMETYLVYESKIDFRKIFPDKLKTISNQMLLPIRLITQRPPKYFQDKLNKPRERLERYGCGSDFSAVEGYPCIDSMVTHYEQKSVEQKLGLAIKALILQHCLCAMEYLPTMTQLGGLNLEVTQYLHQYIAATRLVTVDISLVDNLVFWLQVQCSSD